MDAEGFTAPPNCSLAPRLEKLHLLATTERFIRDMLIFKSSKPEPEDAAVSGAAVSGAASGSGERGS